MSQTRSQTGSPASRQILDTGKPFLTRDALAAGISAKQLRGPRFQALFRGVHVSAEVRATQEQRVRGALLLFTNDRAYASHQSAAAILGVPVPQFDGVHVTVTDPAQRRRRPGLRCHVHRRGRVVRQRGVLVSAPNQLFAELAAHLSLVDLVVAGDNLVRSGLTTPEQLVRFCRTTDLPFAPEALRAARLVRAGVDSPMETRLRLLIVMAGLPEPQVNLQLRTHDGAVVRQYDLSYPDIRVVIEYDGRHHVEREEQWGSDLKRRESSEGNDWRFVVVIAADIFKTPGATVDRIWRVLQARGLPDLPVRPSQEWRAHFPGR